VSWVINESPLLFIGLEQLWEIGLSTPRMDQEPTRNHHVEGQHELTQGPFGPPRPVLSRGVCPVVPKVGPRCSLGFEAACLLVDPSILGMYMCHPLIRQSCFPWIGDMACMHGILGGSPSLVKVMWLDHKR
jgi:hypothetical protein